MNEVKKLKLEDNKQKAYAEFYKDEVDLLQARFEEKTLYYDMEMNTLTIHKE